MEVSLGSVSGNAMDKPIASRSVVFLSTIVLKSCWSLRAGSSSMAGRGRPPGYLEHRPMRLGLRVWDRPKRERGVALEFDSLQYTNCKNLRAAGTPLVRICVNTGH